MILSKSVPMRRWELISIPLCIDNPSNFACHSGCKQFILHTFEICSSFPRQVEFLSKVLLINSFIELMIPGDAVDLKMAEPSLSRTYVMDGGFSSTRHFFFFVVVVEISSGRSLGSDSLNSDFLIKKVVCSKRGVQLDYSEPITTKDTILWWSDWTRNSIGLKGNLLHFLERAKKKDQRVQTFCEVARHNCHLRAQEIADEVCEPEKLVSNN